MLEVKKHQAQNSLAKIVFSTCRSSHLRCSIKKAVLKIFSIFTEKRVLASLFNKVAGMKAFNLIKNRFQHKCFPVNVASFLRTSILKKHICEPAKLVI